jgi:NAD(P)-dependent dehydrogenase (short-subunit alcohol dehydrogenase family)
MRLQDKVAIITGGANGMGRATALRFAREGAQVVVADVEIENAEKVVEEIRAGDGRAFAVQVDVRARDSVEAMVARTVQELGRVDILCSIAGIVLNDPFLELPEEHWERVLAVNLKGVYLCGQVAARQMVKQGGGGKIVNMASTNGLVGEADLAHYNASKFGVVGLTMTMAIELAPHKINVNAVCPGMINTRMTAPYMSIPGFYEDYMRKIPMKRYGEPEEVAGAYVFLASDDANFITGTTLVVDGGQLTF